MRILFCPLASHGFVFPMMGMAKEMAARGHAVAIVTDRSFDGLLAEHGFDRIPRGNTDGPSFQVSLWSEAQWVAVQVEHLEYAERVFQPELMVGLPLTLGPLIVAERTGIPVAQLGFCTYQWPTREACFLQPGNDRERRLAWRIEGWTQLYNESRDELGMPPVPLSIRESPSLGSRFMLRSVPELLSRTDDLPEAVSLVGACLWEPPGEEDPELESWLSAAVESGRPILYVQHGRFFGFNHFWDGLKQVAEAEGLWVAASTSRMDCEIGGLPDGVLARPFLPQSRILQHASLWVGGGNTTAALGGIVEGVPALLIPGGGEQPDVADHCSEVGVAHVLSPPETVGPEQICAGVRHVLEQDHFRVNAARMKDAFARLDGFSTAANVLEGMNRPVDIEAAELLSAQACRGAPSQVEPRILKS